VLNRLAETRCGDLMINPKEFEINFLIENSFHRKKCVKCGSYFWTLDENRTTCGESPCDPYTFLRKHVFKGRYSLSDMRNAFLKFFEDHGHKVLNPRPVVARWRDDLYLTIASIALFQPFVTDGIIPPPANPLVISQPCIRLVDIDNVGVTMGRHLTIFEMGGHHAFNYPNKEIYWKSRTVEYCHQFLTEVLGADPKAITYKESFWEGGGNAGPSFEVCIGGLEVATLVFMCYKTVNDKYVEMPLKVVDTGYGIERLSWVSRGEPTAFHVIFPNLLPKFSRILGVKVSDSFLSEYVYSMSLFKGDYSSIKHRIAEHLELGYDELIEHVAPLEHLFAILDHTKCLAFMLADGVVPSNSGEGYLARLVIRRALKIIKLLNVEYPLSELVALQIDFWSKFFPRLAEMRDVIIDMVENEERKYKQTIDKGVKIVERVCKRLIKAGKRTLSLDALIELYDSHGIPPEIIEKEASKLDVKVEVPENFYTIVAERHQRKIKQKISRFKIEIDVSKYPKTKLLFYDDPYLFEFKAKVLDAIKNYVVLDQTAFYPEGGGQPPDEGVIVWDSGKTDVIDVKKVDGVVVHVVRGPLPPIGIVVTGIIDRRRRLALMRSHTATHIVLAAATKILGKHVWQAGAQKDVDKSRLDITHYKAISPDELKAIEIAANRYVMSNINVKTLFMNRTDAEQKYGFRLYQGGVVPGREIRVVEIEGVDVQACGGTHCRSTGEVGLIKILRASKIQDGVIRLEFTCGESAVKYVQSREELLSKIANELNAQVERAPEAIYNIKAELKELKQRYRWLWKSYVNLIKSKLIEKAKVVNGIYLITELFEQLSTRDLIDIATSIIRDNSNCVILLFTPRGKERVEFIIVAGEPVVSLGFNANQIAKEISNFIGGKGGGKVDFAQGSGRRPDNLEEVGRIIEKAIAEIAAKGREQQG